LLQINIYSHNFGTPTNAIHKSATLMPGFMSKDASLFFPLVCLKPLVLQLGVLERLKRSRLALL